MKTDLTTAIGGAIIDALGEEATVTPSGGGGSSRTITGVFGQYFDDTFDMQSQETTFTIPVANNTDVVVGTDVTVRSTNWTVIRVEEDGSGLKKLKLHEA